MPVPIIKISDAINSSTAKKVLHVLPNFGIGGVPLRTVRIINNLKGEFSHQIISLDGNFDAAIQFTHEANVVLLEPPRQSQHILSSVQISRLALRQLRPQLLFTYNWGAIEWAIANRLSPICRHVHFEAGFGKEEADSQLMRRVLCRRWALARCSEVVVPSRRLKEVALRVWKLPSERVTYVPEGVDVGRFCAPARDAIPGFVRGSDELIIGTVAPLRPEKNIERLLHVFTRIALTVKAVRLIISGDGSERSNLERLASKLGIADRTVFTGHVQPEAVLGTFDVFALSSDTEQMPITVLEAMAAGRAIASVDVGDVKEMVCEENRAFIVPRDDQGALSIAIQRLLSNSSTRESIGRKNCMRAIVNFSQRDMFRAYQSFFTKPD